MSEVTGENDRQPPSPDQMRAIADLVGVLAPDQDEAQKPQAASAYPPNSRPYSFEDDEGARHILTVTNYEYLRNPDEPDTTAFINDVEVGRPLAPTHYRVVTIDGRSVLKIEELDATMYSGAYGDMFGVGLAELADAALQDIDSEQAARELDLDRANSAQAGKLIRLLEAAQERGETPTL